MVTQLGLGRFFRKNLLVLVPLNVVAIFIWGEVTAFVWALWLLSTAVDAWVGFAGILRGVDTPCFGAVCFAWDVRMWLARFPPSC